MFKNTNCRSLPSDVRVFSSASTANPANSASKVWGYAYGMDEVWRRYKALP
jgi:hypothetical protein